MSNDLENLFLLLKNLGLFKEYKDYEEFKRSKYGDCETIDDFKAKMTPEERKDFEYLFGK